MMDSLLIGIVVVLKLMLVLAFYLTIRYVYTFGGDHGAD
jgi:hypothetical protein